jgi:Na+/H+ antiporter NhaD/arsenite permease-like protein
VPEPLALVLSLLALAATLAAAVRRAPSLPEAAVATGGAALLVALGAISFSGARHALGALGPTVGFLAALLVLAEGCRREGVFTAIGAPMELASHGRATRLLALTFTACAVVTAVLGLDATVVLLTPVVFATAARLVAAAADADLLVMARDGDRSRLGPRSIGPHARFALDHAPCPVLLVWPDRAPPVSTLPPPPR